MVLYMTPCLFAIQVIEHGIYTCILLKISYKILSVIVFIGVYYQRNFCCISPAILRNTENVGTVQSFSTVVSFNTVLLGRCADERFWGLCVAMEHGWEWWWCGESPGTHQWELRVMWAEPRYTLVGAQGGVRRAQVRTSESSGWCEQSPGTHW